MPLVSKRTISKKLENKLFELFFEALASLSKPADIEKFLFSLISPIEKTMLSKRLGIAILLAKGFKYEEIKDILKVSQETISKVSIVLNHRGEGYSIVIKKAIQRKQLDDIFGQLFKNVQSTVSCSAYTKPPNDKPLDKPKDFKF